jgi:hypothetical protein
LKAMLRAADMPVPDTPSHILPLMIGDAHLCRRTSELLLEDHDIYIQPINYPTVAHGQERLRITPRLRLRFHQWQICGLPEVGAFRKPGHIGISVSERAFRRIPGHPATGLAIHHQQL